MFTEGNNLIIVGTHHTIIINIDLMIQNVYIQLHIGVHVYRGFQVG